MAYAKNLGVTTNKLEEATTAAIGLAAKYRLDLKTAFMLVGRASKGQTQMLTRYGIVLDESLTAQEKFNAILKIGADNFYLAEAAAKETKGAIIQLKNEWGDLQEQIGEKYIRTAINAITVTKELIEITNELQKKENQAGYLSAFKSGLTLPMRPDVVQLLNAYNQIQNIIDNTNEFKGGGGGRFFGMGATGGWEETIKGGTEGAAALTKEQISADKRMETLRKRVAEEIRLTGRLNEPRQHAKLMVDFQAEAAARYGENTKQAIEKTREFRYQLDQLEKAQSLARVADGIGQAFTSSFEDAIFEAKNLTEVLNSLAQSIQRVLIQEFVSRPLGQIISTVVGGMLGINTAAKAAVQPSQAVVTGYHVPHTGWKSVGNSPSPGIRYLPTDLLSSAPRLHKGIRSDEYPAILQKGERVIPKNENQRAGNMQSQGPVNIYISTIDSGGVAAFCKRYSRELASAGQMAAKTNFKTRKG
jgi:hypothetical protein